MQREGGSSLVKGRKDSKCRESLRRRLRSKKLVYGSFLAVLLIILGFAYNWDKSSPVSPRLHMIEREVMFNSSENQLADGTISSNGKNLAYFDTKGPHISPVETGRCKHRFRTERERRKPQPNAPRRRGKSVPDCLLERTRLCGGGCARCVAKRVWRDHFDTIRPSVAHNECLAIDYLLGPFITAAD